MVGLTGTGGLHHPTGRAALLLLAFCLEGTLAELCNSANPTSTSTAERLTYLAQTRQGLQYQFYRTPHDSLQIAVNSDLEPVVAETQ